MVGRFPTLTLIGTRMAVLPSSCATSLCSSRYSQGLFISFRIGRCFRRKRNHEEVRNELNLSNEEWIDKSENYLPEDGERLEDFKKRITNIFLKIVKENIDKDVLIVDHVLAIQVISTIIKNEDFNPKIFIPQASLTIINNNINGFEVILDGDISHLK